MSRHTILEENLPIDRHKREILYLLEKNQVLLVIGETGCGKSTRIPQILLSAGIYNKKQPEGDTTLYKWRQICITQPRRVAAIQLAQRVSQVLDCILGSVVGYAVRFDEKLSADETRIKYMTDGLLIRELMVDPLLNSYSVIIVDEAHERGLNNDILLGLLKCILKKREDLKLIVCSATLDIHPVIKFFTSHNKEPAVLVVPGKTYPLKVHYRQTPVANYLEATIETIINIHEENRLASGKILAFVTGQDEVETICYKLKDYAYKSSSRLDLKKLVVFPLYASLKPEQIAKVFEPHSRNCRVCIVSTNVAETSLTIDQVAFVIDCGFTKMKYYDHKTGIDHLVRVPISKSSARQRAGRAGRTRDGLVYRLYSETEYERLADSAVPEIVRSSLVEAIMLLKSFGIRDPRRFRLLSPMPRNHLVSAYEQLYALEAVDEKGDLTSMGESISRLNLDPKLSRALLISCQMNCTLELCKIFSMLQVKDIFQKPPRHNSDSIWSNQHLTDLCASDGDLISYLNIYNQFITNNKSAKWAEKRNLNYNSLLKALEIMSNISSQLDGLGLKSNRSSRKLDDVRRSIASGLFGNIAYLHPAGCYKTVRGEHVVHIHPTSVFSAMTNLPKYVIFIEILNSNKSYIRHLMAVEQNFILEAAPHFYTFSTEMSMRSQ